jgi:hypothetical protein
MKMKRIISGVVLGLMLVAPGACALAKLSEIDLSGCTKLCQKDSNECFDSVVVDCPVGDICFDELELCFDESNECADACNDCEALGTCVTEEDCNEACADHATTCTDMIGDCVAAKESCVRLEIDAREGCLDNLLGCLANCIEDVETKLR